MRASRVSNVASVCVFERDRRNGRNLVPLLWKPVFVEAEAAREGRVRRVVTDLVREDIAREVIELVLGQRNLVHRVADASVELSRFAESAQRSPPPGAGEA